MQKHESVKFSILLFLCLIFLTGADIFDDISTLTTLVKRDVVALPTTLRSMQVDESESSQVNKSLDLLKFTEREIKRSEQGWGWDKWCQLQPKKGNCSSSMLIYYYDTQSDKCREFVYSGCNGNQNKFTKLRDCELFCKGFGLVFEGRSMTKAENCGMQPNPGTCISFGYRHYFDVNERRCKEFMYGGCGGNPNRFADEDTCLHDCSDSGA